MTWITETRRIGRGVTATKRSWLGPLMGEMTMETPRGEAVILHIALSRGDPPMSVCTVWAPLPDRPALRPVQSLRIRRDRRRPHLPSRLWWPEIEVPPD